MGQNPPWPTRYLPCSWKGKPGSEGDLCHCSSASCGLGQVFSVHWVVELGGIAACMVPLHAFCPAGETPHALLGEKKLDVTHIEADTCLSVLSSPLGQLQGTVGTGMVWGWGIGIMTQLGKNVKNDPCTVKQDKYR